jgi:hypothetical protein
MKKNKNGTVYTSKPNFIKAARKDITVSDENDIYQEKNFYAVANADNIEQVFNYVTTESCKA